MQLLWVVAAVGGLALAAPQDGSSFPSPWTSRCSSGYWDSSGGSSQSTGGYFYPAPNPTSPFGAPADSSGDLTPATEAPPLGNKATTVLSGGFSGDDLFPTTPTPPLINKHVYFFAARDPPRTPSPPAAGRAPPPRKVHYKIVFIKAPSLQAQAQKVAQSQARAEHKTLIYVLVKKPEEAAAASVPAPAPTAPSRPEVYFIRYKARAQAVGHDHAQGPDAAYGVPARAGGPY